MCVRLPLRPASKATTLKWLALAAGLTAVALAQAQPSPRARKRASPRPVAIAQAVVPVPTAESNTAQAGGVPIALAQALAAARDNLDVSLARRSLSAARADILAADHAPFPVLTGKLSSIDLQNGVGAGSLITQKRIDKSLGIDWTWERGDKRTLRTLTAERNVTAATADVDDVQSQQLLATIGAYYDLVSAQERIEQLAEVERSSSQIAASAARRVKAGDLGRQDALRTEIDAQRVRADQSTALLERQRASLALAQLIGRTADPARLRATSDWPRLDAAPAVDDPALDAQLALLVESRAEVRAATARVRAAQSAADLAVSQKKADVTWGVSVDHYPGTSTRLVELRASLPLQWGYNYQGEIGRALAQARQAEDALEKARRNTYADLLRLRNEVQSAAARARAFDNDILPRARTVASGAEFAFGKGAIPLTDLLDARRVLRLTLIDALAARTDFATALGVWQLRTRPEAIVPAR